MHVMFVDDEAQVLRGIERMLDCADVDWEVETANSGNEALESMTTAPPDVIVSDMKMPGMSGAELLELVSQQHPSTIRIVLSGQADKEAVYRAVSPMHQYLSKPCEAATLVDTITRACLLRNRLESTASHEILGRVNSLPSLPDLYQKVVTEIESEDGTVANVGEIVAQDPAMTAKILQLANSAIFGIRNTITSPAQAASMIGMDALKALVLSLQVFKSFEGASTLGFSIDALTSHSLRVAGIARHIANEEGLGKEVANESFTAGLLHDVGKLILASNATDEFAKAFAMAGLESIPLCEAERNVLGISHDGVGGYLLSLWGLPQSIIEGVALHHSPDEACGEKLTSRSSRVPCKLCRSQIHEYAKRGIGRRVSSNTSQVGTLWPTGGMAR